ncbi:MAG: histidine kinase dimerization/phospho-acceptor domain-containing protein [Pseudomonadota bacterium]
MFFDDRLATVLRQRTDSDLSRRTQYRQLLDILGNRKYGRDQSLIAAAWLRMSALAQEIPSPDRAVMVREPGWRFRNADLAAHLAESEPEVASAALYRAQLSEEDWSALIPRLPVRARGFLRRREDLPVNIEELLDQLGVYDRGLPSPSQVTKESEPEQDATFTPVVTHGPVAEEPLPPQDNDTIRPTDPVFDETEAERSEISALVERIAQFRRERDDAAEDAELSPRLPLGETLQPKNRKAHSFGFVADAAGRIEWAETDVAPMVIGTRLMSAPEMGAQAQKTSLETAFARRQPLVSAAKTLAGASAIEGEWIVDAQPRFTDDGSFAGYVGRFRRPLQSEDDDTPTPAQQEADRIRQLLHELRTPVTAVQGYAEVIQTQMFGPAPHEYRALAAVIAADAAHILAGFEELDRLAKLETGALEMETGNADLGNLARETAWQLSQVLNQRMAGVELADADDGEFIVALDKADAETLLWRFLATLAGGCGTGEVLKAHLSKRLHKIALTCDLPAQLAKEDDIFAAEVKPIGSTINAGLFGAGFAMRLARAEASAAGGNLVRDNETVTLLLPWLNGNETVHNHAR